MFKLAISKKASMAYRPTEIRQFILASEVSLTEIKPTTANPFDILALTYDTEDGTERIILSENTRTISVDDEVILHFVNPDIYQYLEVPGISYLADEWLMGIPLDDEARLVVYENGEEKHHKSFNGYSDVRDLLSSDKVVTELHDFLAWTYGTKIRIEKRQFTNMSIGVNVIAICDLSGRNLKVAIEPVYKEEEKTDV